MAKISFAVRKGSLKRTESASDEGKKLNDEFPEAINKTTREQQIELGIGASSHSKQGEVAHDGNDNNDEFK